MNFTCPCCGHKTFPLPHRGSYDICKVCFWEDDEIQFNDPDYAGGANRVSLRQAQINFLKFGACEEVFIQNVQPPAIDEPKDVTWKLLD